jgi:hypothetical protein
LNICIEFKRSNYTAIKSQHHEASAVPAVASLLLPPGSIAYHDEHNMDQSEQWQEWLRSQRSLPPLPPPQPMFTDHGALGTEHRLQEGMGKS